MNIIAQDTMEKLHLDRCIVNLSDNFDADLNQSNEEEDFNYVIDDDEWGNDF